MSLCRLVTCWLSGPMCWDNTSTLSTDTSFSDGSAVAAACHQCPVYNYLKMATTIIHSWDSLYPGSSALNQWYLPSMRESHEFCFLLLVHDCGQMKFECIRGEHLDVTKVTHNPFMNCWPENKTKRNHQTINLTKHFWGFVWSTSTLWFCDRYPWKLHEMIGNSCENNHWRFFFGSSLSVSGTKFWVYAQLSKVLLLLHYLGCHAVKICLDTDWRQGSAAP